MLKFSLRVSGAVTSVNIPIPIIALHLTALGKEVGSPDHLQDLMLDEISRFTLSWDRDNGKGLSSFIIDKIISNLLTASDLESYRGKINEIKSH